VPPNPDFVGYIYGPDPVIAVKMQWEGCFLRSKYKKWMPDDVVKAIESGNAHPPTASGTSGSGGMIAPAPQRRAVQQSIGGS
jgi:hypothetical protein